MLGLIPKFDLPFTAGVPITAQTLGVMLAGLVLGGRKGALAVLLFLFVVALGAPVLSGGRGGLGVFLDQRLDSYWAGLWASWSAVWPIEFSKSGCPVKYFCQRYWPVLLGVSWLFTLWGFRA